MTPTASPTHPAISSLTLFCKVVDNYGDIGICWRLARQLHAEHHVAVTLWVDDLTSFKRLCNEVVIDADKQYVEGVCVRHWRDQDITSAAQDIPDVVIEFFGCHIPPAYITAMAKRAPHPVWINLEGLSAESWVEGCHTLPSPHPTLALTKYFFYPGFTDKTGGLLREAGLQERRGAFQSDAHARAAFLGKLGVTTNERTATLVSLFCYPHAPVLELFDAWQHLGHPIVCLVPEGTALKPVETFLEQPAVVRAHATRQALTVRVIPFVSQPEYDALLWSCDVNFVRGEDSFVRAQWANRPFIWHIYPQDKQLHHTKLNAFLARYAPKTDSLVEFFRSWNGMISHSPADLARLWSRLQPDFATLTARLPDWEQQLVSHGDLASNLLRFCQKNA